MASIPEVERSYASIEVRVSELTPMPESITIEEPRMPASMLVSPKAREPTNNRKMAFNKKDRKWIEGHERRKKMLEFADRANDTNNLISSLIDSYKPDWTKVGKGEQYGLSARDKAKQFAKGIKKPKVMVKHKSKASYEFEVDKIEAKIESKAPLNMIKENERIRLFFNAF